MKIKLHGPAQLTSVQHRNRQDVSVGTAKCSIEKRTVIIGLMLLLGGCTSVGFKHQEYISKLDYGNHQTINMCLYRDANVTEKRVEQIVDAINEDFRLYNLSISVPWVRQLKRDGITYQQIRGQLIDLPLEQPCDRMLYLVGRNGFDHLWGAFALPEVFGWVDNQTGTRGYVVANHSTSWNQLIYSVKRTARHEALHLLGCGHASPAEPFMDACYHTIAEAKAKATTEFFPSMSVTGHWYYTRKAVNSVVLGNATDKFEAQIEAGGLSDETPVRFGSKVELDDSTRAIQKLLMNYAAHYKHGNSKNLAGLVTKDIADNDKLGKSRFENTYKELFSKTMYRTLVFNIENVVDAKPNKLRVEGIYYAKLAFNTGDILTRASPISIWIDTGTDGQKISRLEY